MSQADVAVVVEVVCGPGAARVFTGADPKPGQGWEDAFDQGCLGQVGGRVRVGNRGRAVSLPVCTSARAPRGSWGAHKPHHLFAVQGYAVIPVRCGAREL